ncbi:hypothetical protein JW933_03505, partial [candidate division FCPU426 bacterium]|nr:hypothetical protein [candidate division FCPU426 bacterium]
MRKWFVIGGAAVVALVLAAVFLLRGPDMAQYDFLLSPRITVLPEQRVLEVEFEGTLEMVMKDAFMQAFKTYYRMKGVPKGPKQPAPRARFVIPA